MLLVRADYWMAVTSDCSIVCSFFVTKKLHDFFHDCNEDRVDVDSEGFELSFHNKKVAFDSDTKSIGIGCFHLRSGVGKRGSVCRGGRPSWRFVIVVFMLCYCCCCMFCEEEQL